MNANVTARRDFIKLALAASSLPFIPSVGFASAFADDRTATSLLRRRSGSVTYNQGAWCTYSSLA